MPRYFNTVVARGAGAFDGIPGVAKYLFMAVSGIGPLWFVQLLWLLCLVLLLVRKLDSRDKLWNACGKLKTGGIILLGILFWAGAQTLIKHPRPESADGLLNLYKPVFYLINFLLGYFVFSHESNQQKLKQAWIPLVISAVISGAVLIATTFGQDNTSGIYMSSPLNCLYGWLGCLTMMAWFMERFDYTDRFAGYMTRTSFGLYIVHYLVVASIGYMMKGYTQLPPSAMYFILTVAVFTLSPALYEILHRIPVVRWCVFGEK